MIQINAGTPGTGLDVAHVRFHVGGRGHIPSMGLYIPGVLDTQLREYLLQVIDGYVCSSVVYNSCRFRQRLPVQLNVFSAWLQPWPECPQEHLPQCLMLNLFLNKWLHPPLTI